MTDPFNFPHLRMNDDNFPELLFVPPDDNAKAQRLSRLKRAGRIKQLYRGVYSTNLRAPDTDIVMRNWSAILAYLAPGAVISHRSAFAARPEAGAVFFSRDSGARKFSLPGLLAHGMIKAERGPILTADRPGANDVPYKGLYMASPARAFLENLTTDKRLVARQLPRTVIETRLDQILALRGD
jgi:hypothetical protein